MLSLKTKTTNKKFYGKWLYKVSLDLPGCTVFRTESFDKVIEFCSEPDPDKIFYYSWKNAHSNKDNILKFCHFIKDKKDYSFRIERSSIDVYTNDSILYEDVSATFDDILIHRFEPNESTIDLLNSNQSTIAVDKLPKGRYNYRVYLLPHKMKGDRDGKEKYLEWLKKQSPRITCTPAIESWFIKTDWNWDRRYVLVEDEPTLLMLKLRNSEVVGRIYNFVVSDK